MPVSDEQIAAAIAALSPEEQTQLESALGGGDEFANVQSGASSSTDRPAPPTPDARGPVERFFEPIGRAIKGMASLPGAVASAMPSDTDPNPFAGIGRGAEAGIVEPSLEQWRQVAPALERGEYGEAAGRALASIPVAGPAGAEMGEAVREGNYAGAAGQAVVNLAPLAPGGLKPTAIASLLRNRAAARILDAMRPAAGRVKTAENIALEVAEGTPGREMTGGIGIGSRATLAKRAAERARLAGEDVRSLQSLTSPIDVKPITGGLREEAAGLETALPTGGTYSEHPALAGALREQAGQVEQAAESFGNAAISKPPAPGTKRLYRGESSMRRKIPGRVTKPGSWFSDNPADADLYANQFPGYPGRKLTVDVPEDVVGGFMDAPGEYVLPEEIAATATEYGNPHIPAGELFKQRAALGRRVAKSYRTAPGDEPAAGMLAGQATRAQFSRALREQLPDIPVADIDRAYHVWKNAATNFEKSRLSALTARGWRGLRDLLVGRAAGVAIGAGAGLGFGPLGGVAGAIGGGLLGESALWQTMRASTYARMARALNSGNLDAAAEILQRAELAYAADKSIRDRELNRRAQKALQDQAEGVIAP